MANPALAGFVYSSNGQGVNAISVNVYAAGDTTTKISSATTDATGAWSIPNSSVQNPDIELVNGTEITRFKYGDKIALTQADVQTFVVRNDTATSSFAVTINPVTLTAARTLSLPDQSGTLITSSGSTNEVVFSVASLTANRVITVPDVAGNMLVAEQFRNASQIVYGTGVTVYQTATQSLSTALVNDTHLQLALASAAIYSVSLYTESSWSANSPSGTVAKFAVPTGANLQGTWLHESGGNPADVAKVTDASSATITSTSSGAYSHSFIGVCETSATAGTIVPQWRQANATADASGGITIAKNGWMSITRISS